MAQKGGVTLDPNIRPTSVVEEVTSVSANGKQTKEKQQKELKITTDRRLKSITNLLVIFLPIIGILGGVLIAGNLFLPTTYNIPLTLLSGVLYISIVILLGAIAEVVLVCKWSKYLWLSLIAIPLCNMTIAVFNPTTKFALYSIFGVFTLIVIGFLTIGIILKFKWNLKQAKKAETPTPAK